MTKIDQFESVFKASAKQVYAHTPIRLTKVLVVTDLDPYQARLLGDRVRQLVPASGDEAIAWRDLAGVEFKTVGELLQAVESEHPDLICAYRNLHSEAWRWPYSLGSHLDVLTQVTTTPVLVLPRPDRESGAMRDVGDTRIVMAITDHLAGDDRLVDYAVRFTAPGGTLILAHVEDAVVFHRYMEVVSKIPMIETDTAREEIARQLLKEPSDYVRSCRQALEEEQVDLSVVEIVQMGHHLPDYKRLIEERGVDLLVLNTKDEDQLAMHGLAYPLAIELRDTPLLMV
jgi:hypothetical protein